MTRDFIILDVPITLTGPDDVVAPIVAAYRRFMVSGHDGAVEARQVQLDSLEADHIVDGDRTVPFVRDLNATFQLYQVFLDAAYDRISGLAVLHAAALVDARDRAILIAGPSGHGKTSLTLALLSRGFRFLSDDYAPLDLSSHRVSPYPRTVGVIVDGGATIPPSFRRAAQNPGAPRLLEKALVDVGSVLGEEVVAQEPTRLRHVVVLTSEDGRANVGRSRVDIGVWRHGVSRFAGGLSGIGGLEILERRDHEHLSVWRVELRHEQLPIRNLSALLCDDALAFSQKYSVSKPDFKRPPRLSRIKRREAATWLAGEMLNRRARGRLLQEYNGDQTALFLDLAAALSDADCWKLRPGRFSETVAMIESLSPMNVPIPR